VAPTHGTVRYGQRALSRLFHYCSAYVTLRVLICHSQQTVAASYITMGCAQSNNDTIEFKSVDPSVEIGSDSVHSGELDTVISPLRVGRTLPRAGTTVTARARNITSLREQGKNARSGTSKKSLGVDVTQDGNPLVPPSPFVFTTRLPPKKERPTPSPTKAADAETA
jgi:hypothetical protein